MKSLKKFAVASMTCAALLGFAATSHAAYQLNDEVKDATPALLMASQIGVKPMLIRLWQTCLTKTLSLL